MKVLQPTEMSEDLKLVVVTTQTEPVTIQSAEGDTICIKYSDFIDFMNRALFGPKQNENAQETAENFGFVMKPVTSDATQQPNQ